MLEELERRNFTDSTRRAYFRIIEDFALHFHRRPGTHPRIDTHLFRDRKLSDSSVHQTVGALRFFFVKMLKRPWRVEETPYPKRRMRLPLILSRDEVARPHVISKPAKSNSPFAVASYLQRKTG
jgi:integrase/recombinase XerD